jgi:hypothetical protein
LGRKAGPKQVKVLLDDLILLLQGSWYSYTTPEQQEAILRMMHAMKKQTGEDVYTLVRGKGL